MVRPLLQSPVPPVSVSRLTVVAAAVAPAAVVVAKAEEGAPHALDEGYRPCQDESICVYMNWVHGILVFMQTSRRMRTEESLTDRKAFDHRRGAVCVCVCVCV